MTKADIIAAILEGVTRHRREMEHDDQGNAVRMEETITDAYGELLGTRQGVWTYYNTGEVNVITMQEFDADHKLTGGYAVKHFRDGRQPILTTIGPK
jgi:hypothetical protein